MSQGIEAKMERLLEADLSVNDGEPHNAPYKVYHDGELYIGKFKRGSSGERWIDIIRPERVIGSLNLRSHGNKKSKFPQSGEVSVDPDLPNASY